ncbi:NHL domain-containing protein [Larkinella arboricola]
MTSPIRYFRIPFIGILTTWLSLAFGLVTAHVMAQTIITVAGNGKDEYSGDNVSALHTSLFNPQSVAVDQQGNIYIADAGSSRVRKVDSNGIITTVAGNGRRAFSGDGGPATSAAISGPLDLAIDQQGNILIIDSGNDRIRKVTPDGIISTIAGGGPGNFETKDGDGGPATSAYINPSAIAVDAQGNIFITESNRSRGSLVRKIDANGIITTVAGQYTGGQGGNGGGYGGDGGPATSATLNSPAGLAVDAQGNVFIADAGNNRIRKIDTNGIITTVAGSGTRGYTGDGGPATSATLSSPGGIVVDPEGNLFMVDRGNYVVRKVDSNGIISTFAGTGHSGFGGDGGPATEGVFFDPRGIEIDAQGSLLVADVNNQRIRKITKTTIPLAVTSFSLINSETNQEIKQLTNGEVLNLNALPTRHLNIRVNTTITTVGSVVVVLRGPLNRIRTEMVPPYSVLSDDMGVYDRWTPAVGNYALFAIAHTFPDGNGPSGTPLSINFTVVDQPQVLGFSLVDAITDQTILELTEGQELDLAKLPGHVFNIRANTSPATVGSVVMQLSGTQTRTQLENAAPYALFKDDGNGNYRTWKPAVGSYQLTATPYSDPNGTGSVGIPLSLGFQFVNSAPAARLAAAADPEAGALRVFPNPFRDSFTFRSTGPQNTIQSVRLYDVLGRLVWQGTDGETEQRVSLDRGLADGVYVLQVGTGPSAKRYKLVKAH